MRAMLIEDLVGPKTLRNVQFLLHTKGRWTNKSITLNRFSLKLLGY